MPFEDLWIGEMIGLEVAGLPVLLVKIEAEVRAYVDSCPHQRSRLSEGELAGCALTCGTHRWEFDALTGHGLNPSTSQLAGLPVRVREGMIEVMVEAGRSGLRGGMER
jgi:toluene monooxygenase system ferredoxin subunit